MWKFWLSPDSARRSLVCSRRKTETRAPVTFPTLEKERSKYLANLLELSLKSVLMNKERAI